ncbi:ABC transporter substrate-binding protein [Bifidobacterium simiiventris]|uniref:ABC transporter substrate-binding protein n=1 Tax=Bifidobacterium simiiventris TaxID=2834434 RepID=UPI001C5595A8|nr:ABC transporter substrate-binding protein [Bifidobacterium simiiventris]MBW3078945.1 ABC transporter substrate-binding protein [Bifidobacterium simiiventris]
MHHKRVGSTALRSWLVFIAMTVALSLIAWPVWSLATHRDILPRMNAVQSSTSITVGLTDAPDSLDIRTDSSPSVERALLGNVYETLVTRDDDNALQPGLASDWTVSDDALTYTFRLRSGLRFSNGDALDSSDVVWSLQQIVQHKYQGVDDLGALKSVDNPNSGKVVITLSKPDPTLLRSLSGRAGIVYDQQAATDYATAALGSGPFTVAKFDKGSSITLASNGGYWGDPSSAGTVTLKYYTDENTMVTDLKNGTLNMALPTSTSETGALADDKNFTVTTGLSSAKVMIAFNNDGNSIFSDQQARQMVRYAVDAKSIAASQADSAGELGGPISQLEPGYEDLTGLFPFDQSKAAGMIAYFAGGTAYFGTIDFVVPQTYADLGNTIADQLRSLGLDVNVETVDDATATERINDGQYEMALAVANGEHDAAAFGTDSNVYRYTNGSAQDAYANAMAATNDKDYQDRLRTFANIVSQDAAGDWLYTRKTVVAAASSVSGYPKNLTDRYLPLAGLSMK